MECLLSGLSLGSEDLALTASGIFEILGLTGFWVQQFVGFRCKKKNRTQDFK